MTSQTWRSLLQEKYQLSLRLFLFLNALSALFSMLSPLFRVKLVTAPLIIILSLSIAMLIWRWVSQTRNISLNLISLLFGALWAWHVYIKQPFIPIYESSYLIIALMSVLFVGALAFINNLKAFICHCLPVIVTVLWLDHGQHTIRMLYAVLLPMAGIVIQHLIQKRNDAFAQGLMFKLMEEKKTLTDLSMIDPLTGLYNRRGFQNRLENLFTLGSERNVVLAVDIDHFKAYNDHYGHMMGDQALARVSAAIRDAVRSRDIVARFGGEEFLVLLSNSDLELARKTAERIRQRVFDLRIPHRFNTQAATNVTISIGLAPMHERNFNDAYKLADKALYKAKNMGRNHILSSDEIEDSE
ncbi:GGDEF domain-containing protein [Atlantibacter hermannii]|uniref:GGDEF domain-containing protein n=1 Tax=Atlantibacter hermannii TaxID=565 RepID=UPI0028AAC61F|nr:diguanylate cyclase [Atlantibacter hermannii]